MTSLKLDVDSPSSVAIKVVERLKALAEELHLLSAGRRCLSEREFIIIRRSALLV